MVCIYCGGETQVTNSRLQKKPNQVWRRRKCVACQGVFTSHEAADFSSGLLFKRDEKRIEPFEQVVLMISLYEACKHRTRPEKAAEALTATVLGRLRAKTQQATLARGDVIAVTSEVLKRYDKAAATAYLAYHPL